MILNAATQSIVAGSIIARLRGFGGVVVVDGTGIQLHLTICTCEKPPAITRVVRFIAEDLACDELHICMGTYEDSPSI